MKTSRTYEIDTSEILRKAYRLLCVFFANKEIARRSDPANDAAPLTSLERRFFSHEASTLLIELAIAIRVMDDQMRKLPISDGARANYEKRRAVADKFSFGLFDDLNLDLRGTCNKIIHSEVMEPHTSEGLEAHELDLAHRYGDDDRTIDWDHLNGYVRLCGKDHRAQEWYLLLDIEIFVTAIYQLLSQNHESNDTRAVS